MTPSTRAFHFEAALLGLNKTKQGCFARFEIQPYDIPRELNNAIPGQRYFVVLTPMPDDLPEPTKDELEEGERAIKFAAVLCKNENFQHYMAVSNEDECATKLRKILGISSRKELRTNLHAVRILYDLHKKYEDDFDPL